VNLGGNMELVKHTNLSRFAIVHDDYVDMDYIVINDVEPTSEPSPKVVKAARKTLVLGTILAAIMFPVTYEIDTHKTFKTMEIERSEKENPKTLLPPLMIERGLYEKNKAKPLKVNLIIPSDLKQRVLNIAAKAEEINVQADHFLSR
jgi:hypothetical protein